jgi:hypothetical protein
MEEGHQKGKNQEIVMGKARKEFGKKTKDRDRTMI